jgi:hypothetical protein
MDKDTINDEYDMNHARRGQALVINNRDFADDEFRTGAEKDLENIKESLQKLDFEVHVEENCNSWEMKNLMLSYANMDHSDSDCFLCVIMSHGDKDAIVGVDGSGVYIKELIYPFKLNTTLKGKPKLFFINACRGHNDSNMTTASSASGKTQQDLVNIEQHPTSLDSFKIPLEADVLVHYSTVTGYVSFRNENNGSWFIESLSHVLNEKGASHPLSQILMAVNNRVAEHYRNENQENAQPFKQMPNVDHTLRKELYFKPKQMKTIESTSTPTTSSSVESTESVRLSEMNQYFGKKTFNDGWYEGEFLNGRLHGKGVYVWSNGNRYSGEWVDNEMTGVGECHYHSGNVYEGEFAQGKKHGKGCFIWANGNRYEGEYENGNMHGQGTYTWSNGNMYTGDWLDNEITGRGKFVYAAGDVYEGELLNGKKHGTGLLIWSNGNRYEGEHLEDNLHGKGTFIWSNGNKYSGDWVNNQITGHGKFTYAATGNCYEGDFVENKKHGKGTYTWKEDKEEYTGDWQADNMTGRGKRIYTSGDTYEGEFLNEKKHGHGTYVWSNGNRYAGEWADNEITGQGRFTSASGNYYDGQFLNGKFHGKGVFVWADEDEENGGNRYEGDYEMDEKHGKGTFVWANGNMYSGEWQHDEMTGHGRFTYSSGNYYEGDFLKGKNKGKGVFVWLGDDADDREADN